MKEITLNKLMTSDFVNGETPDELIRLLLEFRKKYRELDNINKQLKYKLNDDNIIINDLQIKILKLENNNDILKNRLLEISKKETIFKKIINIINK